MHGSQKSPPPFSWDEWYSSVGGRSIHIAEVDSILHDIKEYQYPKFKGNVNPVQTLFESAAIAAAIVNHHREWTKDFEGFATKRFPSVELKEPPKPTDPDVPKHWYPQINRQN